MIVARSSKPCDLERSKYLQLQDHNAIIVFIETITCILTHPKTLTRSHIGLTVFYTTYKSDTNSIRN
jgi:hypothetical protein